MHQVRPCLLQLLYILCNSCMLHVKNSNCVCLHPAVSRPSAYQLLHMTVSRIVFWYDSRSVSQHLSSDCWGHCIHCHASCTQICNFRQRVSCALPIACQ
jgi:hypothetical protein